MEKTDFKWWSTVMMWLSVLVLGVVNVGWCLMGIHEGILILMGRIACAITLTLAFIWMFVPVFGENR